MLAYGRHLLPILRLPRLPLEESCRYFLHKVPCAGGDKQCCMEHMRHAFSHCSASVLQREHALKGHLLNCLGESYSPYADMRSQGARKEASSSAGWAGTGDDLHLQALVAHRASMTLALLDCT